MSRGRTAVVLFQLGGPDSLDAVEPFLYNLFCDPDIINFPGAFLARRPLARFIASRRSKKVAAHYREIGGKSPIVDLTMAQAAALEKKLNATIPARVFVAMRYWRPFTGDVIAELRKEQWDRIVLLPLYPQFSKATTVSSLKEWRRQCALLGFDAGAAAPGVCCYYNHPLYIDAIVGRINAIVPRFSAVDPAGVDIVFSAHGIPVSLVNEGDPYPAHIRETVRLVVERGKWPFAHHLCFQSKVGPAEWLKPSLHGTMRGLAERGRKHLLVVPVAFVTEHIETLHEIDIEAREEAAHLGVVQFEMMPALNDSPGFIACLEDLVMTRREGREIRLGSCRDIAAHGAAPTVLCPYWTTSRT